MTVSSNVPPAHISAPAYFIPDGWCKGASDRSLRIAGGWAYATSVRVVFRSGETFDLSILEAQNWVQTISGMGAAVTQKRWAALSKPRAAHTGFDWSRPVIMGIVNVTPDSFSDGGEFNTDQTALNQAQRLLHAGAQIIDIGGESTRPGADPVPPEEELARVQGPVRAVSSLAPVSIDTRRAFVASHMVGSGGAAWINDVMAGREDGMAAQMALSQVPVVIMHCLGQPKTMQQAPQYDHVVLDVYDFLESRIAALIQAGVQEDHILIDPGIGFGKTVDHNSALIRNISVFHGLGCPILFGASRKRLIDAVCNAPNAKDRVSGSVTLALEAVRQGCQVVRVHDVFETKQALDMQAALRE